MAIPERDNPALESAGLDVGSRCLRLRNQPAKGRGSPNPFIDRGSPMKQKEVKRMLENRARVKRRKTARLEQLQRMPANEIAAIVRNTGQEMLRSAEWKELRSRVVAKYGPRCMKCRRHACPPTVDHIKPRALFPELTWIFDNLQVLCGPCNKAKGNMDWTDYRRERIAA